MKTHPVLNTKDEQLAQEVGIAVARSMLKPQIPDHSVFVANLWFCGC